MIVGIYCLCIYSLSHEISNFNLGMELSSALASEGDDPSHPSFSRIQFRVSIRKHVAIYKI